MSPFGAQAAESGRTKSGASPCRVHRSQTPAGARAHAQQAWAMFTSSQQQRDENAEHDDEQRKRPPEQAILGTVDRSDSRIEPSGTAERRPSRGRGARSASQPVSDVAMTTGGGAVKREHVQVGPAGRRARMSRRAQVVTRRAEEPQVSASARQRPTSSASAVAVPVLARTVSSSMKRLGEPWESCARTRACHPPSSPSRVAGWG